MRSNAFLKSNRNTLTVAQLPSVAFVQVCVMLTKASVILERGTVPNSLGSVLASTDGVAFWSTTNSSANLDKMGVRDIGLRYLLMSKTGVDLGIGVMSA